MSKPAGVLTQQQIRAACTAGLASGAEKVVVEATLPSGVKLTVTAHAEVTKTVMHRGGRRTESPSASAPNAAA